MSESIPQLENSLREKEQELSALSSGLTGAGVGAFLTQGSPIGTAVGAMIGHDKEKRAQIEREIADLKNQIDQTRSQISQLQTKKSDLMNSYQNDKAQFESDMRQAYNNIERQKVNEPNPDIARTYDDQLSRLQSDTRQQEVSRDQAHQQELDQIQDQINQLSL